MVKHNLHDGFAQGISSDDAVECAKAFELHGATLLVPSGGFVSRNGFYMLRGNVPFIKMVRAMPGITKSLATLLFGPLFIPKTDYEECFFREGARRVRDAVSIPVALIGGLTGLAVVEGAIREGFGCVQMARALIADPYLPQKMYAHLKRSSDSSSIYTTKQCPIDVSSKCNHCNECVVSTLDPTRRIGCVLRSPTELCVGSDDIEDLVHKINQK